jgi:endo-1,4-beta-xylanase
MEKRRALLTSSCALLLWAAVGLAAEPPGLKDVAPEGFLIGAAVNMKLVDGEDAAGAAIVTRQFNSITDENVLKPGPIHPAADRYSFGPGDRYVAWGQEHGMFVVGHVLVWHQQTAPWFFAGKDGAKLDRETALARMKEHIDTVVGRYRGKVGGWDVVNEAFEDDGSWRRTPWFEAIGEDYVAKAFEYAHAADPEAELYYNDYNLWKPEKCAAAVRLVKDLKARGLRVDAIGEQAHWGLGDPELEQVEAMLATIEAAGLEVHITELDLDVLPRDPEMWGADLSKQSKIRATTNIYPDGLPEEVQHEQARQYGALFALFMRYGDIVKRVTFWGVTDADSWLHNFPIPGRVNYPLLWDREGKPKPAFDAVLEALQTP